MSDDYMDLTQDQFVTLFTNGSVNHTINGQQYTLNTETDTVTLTDAQAEIIVHCLSKLEPETYAASETARQTQELLRQRFDLDQEESILNLDE